MKTFLRVDKINVSIEQVRQGDQQTLSEKIFRRKQQTNERVNINCGQMRARVLQFYFE